MSLREIQNLEIPNIKEILNATKTVKGNTDTLHMNDVNVNFYFADGRFKTTVKGTKSHISGVPVVYIEHPNKLAFIILDNSLVFDVSTNCFELIVNEKFSHTVNINDLNSLDINNKLKKLLENVTFIVPTNTDLFKYEEFYIDIPNPITKTIDSVNVVASHLSSLGRAKLLENTTSKSNDGLIIVGFIGFLIGAIIATILTLIIVMG